MAIKIDETGIYDGSGNKLLDYKQVNTPAVTGTIVDSLIGDNGYIKYDNGLIIQWGYNKLRNTSRTSYYDIPFHISFTEKVFNLQLTSRESVGLDNTGQYFYALTVSSTEMKLSGFKFRIIDNSGGSGDVGVNWIAIGR